MKEPKLIRENTKTHFASRFLNMYELSYDTLPHYFDASRHSPEDLVAMKNAQEHHAMLPDGVSCVVIVEEEEPKLLLFYEYRYPIGQSVLSIPAGLVDPKDTENEQPLFSTAIREIYEETGLEFNPQTDSIQVLSPLLFSSPGMTDESNGFVCVHLHSSATLGKNHAESSEHFDRMMLVTKEEAQAILKRGYDENGLYFSVYTWMALVTFVSGLYQ